MSVVKQIREPRVDYLELEEPALLRGFELLAMAEGGVAKLRELILTLALQGKLVPQSTKDEPASTILAKIRKEKAALATTGNRKANVSAPMNHGANAINVPAGWCASSLAEIGIISPRNTTDDDTLTSFVPMSAIPAGLMETHATEQRQWGEIKSGFTHFAEGDVGLAKITPCFENGKSTIFRNLENGIGAGTTELHIVRPLGNVLPEYILIFLKSPTFLKNGETGMTGSAGQKRLPRTYFESTPFPLPPLAEQRRIVTRVEELLTLCDELETRGRLADEQHTRLTTTLFDALTASDSAQTLADNWQRIATHFDLLLDRPQAIDALEQTILQLAVRGLLVPQGASNEPASALLKRVQDNTTVAKTKFSREPPDSCDVPFVSPRGWEWVTFDNVVECLNGYAFKSGSFKLRGTRLVRNVNVSHGQLDWADVACVDEQHAEEFSRFALMAGDIVLTLDRPIISTGLKYAEVRPSDLPCLLLQRVAKLTPRAGAVTNPFLMLWLNSAAFLDALDPGRSNGVPHISTKQIGTIPFALPPLAEQHRIVARVEQLRRLCADLRERLNKVRATQTHLAEALVTETVQPQRGVRLG